MFNIRKNRLSQEIQEQIAAIIQQEIRDPRMGFVTITKVELSNDGSHAKVGYSLIGNPEDRTRTQEALDDASGYVRSLLRKRLHVKITPELVFRYDQSIQGSIDMAARLDTLIEPPQPPAEQEQP